MLQAVEANQFVIRTKFSFLHNMARTVAKDVVYRVEAWGGGIVADTGILLKGKFRWVMPHTAAVEPSSVQGTMPLRKVTRCARIARCDRV